MPSIAVFTDGGSRGNPGPAATGFLVYEENGTLLHSAGRYIGSGTNNEAEYQAVLDAIAWLSEPQNQATLANMEIVEIVWQLDSKLVVEQVNKKWRIKEPRLGEFAKKIWASLEALPQSSVFIHIRRELNAAADALVNEALDAQEVAGK